MFANLTYKQKLKWLLAGALVAFFLCYQLSIRKTIEEYSKYEQSSMTSDQPEQPGISIQSLQEKNTKINALYDQFLLDTLQPDKNLLSVSSNYCKANGLILKEYKPVGFYRNDSLPVLTRLVTAEGSFTDCLRLLYILEKEKKAGKVSGAEFKSYTDPKDKTVKLDCTIYVQNLISYQHENY